MAATRQRGRNDDRCNEKLEEKDRAGGVDAARWNVVTASFGVRDAVGCVFLAWDIAMIAVVARCWIRLDAQWRGGGRGSILKEAAAGMASMLRGRHKNLALGERLALLVGLLWLGSVFALSGPMASDLVDVGWAVSARSASVGWERWMRPQGASSLMLGAWAGGAAEWIGWAERAGRVFLSWWIARHALSVLTVFKGAGTPEGEAFKASLEHSAAAKWARRESAELAAMPEMSSPAKKERSPRL